ncbi:hypothetical protein ACIUDV_10245 (plasmid) [Limosilactobacillus reuteri]|uniref:hypothetical protein n=1 Tax=Limosilactobacillus reuteri TaxID=1598 RepID=UPI00386920EC
MIKVLILEVNKRHTIRLAYTNTFLKPMLTEFLKADDANTTLMLKWETSSTIIEQGSGARPTCWD